VEASSQGENVRIATSTSESDRSLHFPLARRVADPKTKIFTFEGLTPVSTVDDTREDAIIIDTLLDKERGVIRDENYIVCSPLTSDLSFEKDQNDDNYDYVVNRQIVSVSSTVKEKVVAWEKQLISWRSTDMYDVPFDEDPMRKVTANTDGPNDAAIGEDFDITKETITEIPIEDVVESDVKLADHVEAVVFTNTVECNVVSSSEQSSTNPTQQQQLIASMTNLLDEDEEAGIHTAPSDEDEKSAPIVSENRELQEPLGSEPIPEVKSMVESFGCPDAICTQVSKLWQ
jgi:hypothetical protein